MPPHRSWHTHIGITVQRPGSAIAVSTLVAYVPLPGSGHFLHASQSICACNYECRNYCCPMCYLYIRRKFAASAMPMEASVAMGVAQSENIILMTCMANFGTWGTSPWIYCRMASRLLSGFGEACRQGSRPISPANNPGMALLRQFQAVPN